eukprot:3545605-Pyramimonas_sp.AAC.1
MPTTEDEDAADGNQDPKKVTTRSLGSPRLEQMCCNCDLPEFRALRQELEAVRSLAKLERDKPAA